MNGLESELVNGLEGFLADLKGDQSIEKKYTCRRVVLDLKLHPYTIAKVKATRRLLNASQGLFAQFLGVSVKAVAPGSKGGHLVKWPAASWTKFAAIPITGRADCKNPSRFAQQAKADLCR